MSMPMGTLRLCWTIGICGFFALSITSCTTPYSGPTRSTYKIDVTITTDPPNASIYSVQGRSQVGMTIELTDYAYEKYGSGQFYINSTPYRAVMTIETQEDPGGIVGSMWNTVEYNSGGDAIMLVKVSKYKHQGFFYTEYQHRMDLSYILKLDGYKDEAHTVTIANGRYPFVDMYREASSKPIVLHHVLQPE
jgi:hypothetical protein